MNAAWRIAMVLCVVAAGAVAGRRAAAADSCVDCHAALPEPLGVPAGGFERDVHAAAGLSCADCHGGDPSRDADDEAMDPARGYVGTPEPRDVPAFCGRCHADAAYMARFDPGLPTTQVQEYWTGPHGAKLHAGNTRVATCVSCHGAHGIRPVADATSPVHATNVAQTCGTCHANADRMAGTGLPTDQLSLYLASVHARRLLVDRDAAAPTCNDCHGSHGPAPAGLKSAQAACGQCHAMQQELFAKSPHRDAFARRGLAACTNHHGDHGVAPATDAMVGTGPGSTCLPCHPAGSAAYATADAMGRGLAELRAAIAAATAALDEAAHAGMEVSEAEYAMKSAGDALIQARTLVHTADGAQVQQAIDAGLATARAGEAAGRRATQEFQNRRRLAIIPLTMIALVCGLLYLKIRSLGGRLGRHR